MKKTICIAGKNNIAVTAMQYLLSLTDMNLFTLVACVTKTDDGKNTWQPSFRYFCNQHGVEILTLEKCYEIEDIIFISLEFDRIVRTSKFKSDRLFNVHFSKLPAYKGMFTALLPILHGQKETGVSLHRIDKGIDTGEIIDQICFPLDINTTASELYDLFLEKAIVIFKKNIDSLINNREQSEPQPLIGSTYYSKCAIDFSCVTIDLNKTAWEIHNQIRAFCFRAYQLPKIYDLFIYKSEVIENVSVGKPGSIFCQDEWTLILNTIDFQVKLYIDKSDSLFESAANGDTVQYDRLVSNSFPTNIRDKEGRDALLIATLNNQSDFVQHLLNSGWDVNTKDYGGQTAAMYGVKAAAVFCDLSLLKSIFFFSPDLKVEDDKGNDISSHAKNSGSPEVIEYLNICSDPGIR